MDVKKDTHDNYREEDIKGLGRDGIDDEVGENGEMEMDQSDAGRGGNSIAVPPLTFKKTDGAGQKLVKAIKKFLKEYAGI